MPNSDIKLSFKINAWLAHSSGLSQPNEWKTWSQTLEWPSEGKVDVSAVPPMMRRRMSNLSKMAVQTSIELLNQYDVDYLVFASRHGELARSAKLIEEIVAGEEASPMAFSQSVHNTAAGLATIATKKPIPLTSIAAGENTFQSAMVEAWAYLENHPDHKVLLVDFDEPLPDVYEQYENQTYQGYALGLVLSKGDEYSFSKATSTTDAEPKQPQGLEFIRYFLSDQTQWTLQAPNQTWIWQKQ